MKFLGSTIGKVLAAAIALILVLGFLQLRSCQQARQQAAQSKVGRGQSGAFHQSASEAVNSIGGVAANQMASEDLTRQNEREIRDAPGANDPVNPGARDAGIASLCRRAAYRNDQRCRVQQPRP